MLFRGNRGKSLIGGYKGLGSGTIAHLDGSYSENSIDSFLAAHKAGADFVVTSVARTADDKLVISDSPLLPNGTALDSLTSIEAITLGLTPIEEVFKVLPTSLAIFVEVKHVLEDTNSKRIDTAGLAAIAIVEERRKNGRNLAIFGADFSTATRVKPIVSRSGVYVGALANSGDDFPGMILSAHRNGLDFITILPSLVLGDKALQDFKPLDLQALLSKANSLNIATMLLCPTPMELTFLAEFSFDAVCLDKFSTF
jgi:glycerophosphoryl diester phosphodiesterase